MSTLVLPQSMVADREAGIKANAQHVDDNFDALTTAVNGKLDLDGSSTPTNDISMGNHKLTNIATPTTGGDAATKGYVDSELTAYSTRNLTFTGTVNVTTQATSDNSTKVATTAYVIDILKAMYPVGSIYIGTQSTCPLATLIPGSTWTKIQGRYLLASGTLNGTSETYSATNTVSAGLPNITGYGNLHIRAKTQGTFTGALYQSGSGNAYSGDYWESGLGNIGFDASRSNSIYGASATVRAPAYVINVWRRTA